jgi:AcrR family transcriptional regulator
MTDRAPKYRRYSSEVRAAMLIEAGLACLAEGGIRAFTVDNICRISGASRGLITHHFGSKDRLLAAVYAAAYQPLLTMIEPAEGPPPLPALLDHLFSPANYSRESLNIWLAIWGEVAANPALQAEHRSLYGRYRATVASAIAAHAEAQGRTVAADELAGMLIALVDGLWLELSISPDTLSPARARASCAGLLEQFVGPVPPAGAGA